MRHRPYNVVTQMHESLSVWRLRVASALAHFRTCALPHLRTSALAHLLTCTHPHIRTCTLAHLHTCALPHLRTMENPRKIFAPVYKTMLDAYDVTKLHVQLHARLKSAFRGGDGDGVDGLLHRLRVHYRTSPPAERLQLLRTLHPIVERMLLSQNDWKMHAYEWNLAPAAPPLNVAFILGAPTLGGYNDESSGGAFRLPERILGVRSLLGINQRRPRERDRNGNPLLHTGFAHDLAPIRSSAIVGELDALARMCGRALVDEAFRLMGVAVTVERKPTRTTITAHVHRKKVGELVVRPLSRRRMSLFYTTSLGKALGVPLFHTNVVGCEAMARRIATDDADHAALDSTVDGAMNDAIPRAMRHGRPRGGIISRIEHMLYCKLFAMCLDDGTQCVVSRVRMKGGFLDGKHAAFLSLGCKFLRAFEVDAMRSGDEVAALYLNDPLVLTSEVYAPNLMLRPTPSIEQLQELVALALSDHVQMSKAFHPVVSVPLLTEPLEI